MHIKNDEEQELLQSLYIAYNFVIDFFLGCTLIFNLFLSNFTKTHVYRFPVLKKLWKHLNSRESIFVDCINFTFLWGRNFVHSLIPLNVSMALKV